MLTEREVMQRLRAAIEQAGGQNQFARAHGFTNGYISDVLHGKRALADRILASIGVVRKTVYQLQDKEGNE